MHCFPQNTLPSLAMFTFGTSSAPRSRGPGTKPEEPGAQFLAAEAGEEKHSLYPLLLGLSAPALDGARSQMVRGGVGGAGLGEVEEDDTEGEAQTGQLRPPVATKQALCSPPTMPLTCWGHQCR